MTKKEMWEQCKVYGDVKCDICDKKMEEVVCIISGYEFLKPKTKNICEKCFLGNE